MLSEMLSNMSIGSQIVLRIVKHLAGPHQLGGEHFKRKPQSWLQRY